MSTRSILEQIRTAGFRKSMATVRYALFRDRHGARSQASGPAIAPGSLRKADPIEQGARFRFEHAALEVRFLAADLVRVTWEPGRPPVPYGIAAEAEGLVAEPAYVKMGPANEDWALATSELEVFVLSDGGIRFRHPSGQTLRRAYAPERRGEQWTDSAALHPEEHIYGLGERATPFNLRGGQCELWNRDPVGYTAGVDPLYLGIPVYMGVHTQGSYLLFYENSYRATLAFAEEATACFDGGALRYYLIPGPPARALQRYAQLTGKPPMPPRWALGYHQSRWGYKSEGEVREIAQGFRENRLPISAIHLDIDYMQEYRIFTVDETRFSDLQNLSRELESQGIRLVAIIDPGVKRDPAYDVYSSGLATESFCTMPSGRPVHGLVWPGWCAFPDFTSPQARSWWATFYPRLLDRGIAGFWHDMNEPCAWAAWGDMTLPLDTRHSMEGRGGDHREAHNLYGLLMNRAGSEALRQINPYRRPFIVSRSGWAGLQRYAWNWTGDIETSWAALRQTVPTVLSLALSGIPYTGPDIGGFLGDPSAELYLRWFQLSTFLPFYRAHSAGGPSRREPWAFGETVLNGAREMLRLRYRLLPYLYTMAWRASREGTPLVRPLFWPDADDPSTWDVDDTFLLGDALLVAPVLEEGATSRVVSFPKGRWYNWWDDSIVNGPAQVRVEAPLERIPLFVRAGAIVPMEEEGRMVLHVYPPAEGETGEGLLYSDAGEGYGDSLLSHFYARRAGGRLEISWEREGEYTLPYPGVELRIHGMEVRRIRIGDRRVAGAEGRFLVEPFFLAIVE